MFNLLDDPNPPRLNGPARAEIARRAARLVRRRRVAAVTAAVGLVAAGSLAGVAVLHAPTPRRVVRTVGRPTTGATPSSTATATTIPSTGPTTATAAPAGALVPAGWQLVRAAEAGRAVLVVATSPPNTQTGQPGAQSVVVRFPLDGSPGATSAVLPAVGQISDQAGRLWAVAGLPGAGDHVAHELVELDPTTLETRRTIPLDGPPESVAADASSVWVGTSTGALERVDVASGRVDLRIPGGYEVTGLALSPDSNLLYEAVNNSLTVIERDSSSGVVLHSRSLEGIAGGGVLSAAGRVWVHYATGMADDVQGLRSSDLFGSVGLGGVDLDESAERLGSVVVGPTLIVIGYQRAGCFDAATGGPLASFALPTPASTTSYTAGTDGMFSVTSAGPRPVALPLACTNGGPGGSPRAVLTPATVAPTGDECLLPLTRYQDGNAGPLLCPGGGVNVAAWQAFSEGADSQGSVSWSQTLGLGPNATAARVWQAMCADKARLFGTNPMTLSAEKLAASYYAWSFHGPDPAAEFQEKGCPAR